MNIDLFKHIAEIAPGFIAVAVHDFYVGDLHDKQNKYVEYERYFVYSGLIWLLIETAVKNNIIEDDNRIIVSLAMAVLLGFLWPSFLKAVLFKIVNFCTKANGHSEKVDAKSLLAIATDDGQPHYLLIYKNDKLIAEGTLEYTLDSERSLSVCANPEWKKHYEENAHGEKVLYYLDKDTYIKEYYLL